MTFAPDAPVSVEVDKIPGRKRKRIEIAQRGPAFAPDHGAVAATQGKTSNAAKATTFDPVYDLAQHGLTLAQDDRVRAGIEIQLRMIDGVRTAHDHLRGRRLGSTDHGACGI